MAQPSTPGGSGGGAAAALSAPAAPVAGAGGAARPTAEALIGSSLDRLIKLCGRERRVAHVSAAASELKDQLPEVRGLGGRGAAAARCGARCGGGVPRPQSVSAL